MSDDVFRIVVTVAVGLACLASLLVAGIAFAFYGTARRLQRKVDELAGLRTRFRRKQHSDAHTHAES